MLSQAQEELLKLLVETAGQVDAAQRRFTLWYGDDGPDRLEGAGLAAGTEALYEDVMALQDEGLTTTSGLNYVTQRLDFVLTAKAEHRYATASPAPTEPPPAAPKSDWRRHLIPRRRAAAVLAEAVSAAHNEHETVNVYVGGPSQDVNRDQVERAAAPLLIALSRWAPTSSRERGLATRSTGGNLDDEQLGELTAAARRLRESYTAAVW